SRLDENKGGQPCPFSFIGRTFVAEHRLIDRGGFMQGKLEAFSVVQAGDLEKLRSLLAQDPSLASARNEAGVTAIMHALYTRRKDVLDLLLAAKPDLDIFEAASLGSVARVTELLDHDPELVTSWSADGFTPLHFACFFGQETIAFLLLQYGADVAAVSRNPMKVMPLHSAVAA